MPSMTRRSVLISGIALAIPAEMLMLLSGCSQPNHDGFQNPEATDDLSTHALNTDPPNRDPEASNSSAKETPMNIHYLEIVTPEVEAICRQYSTIYGITFSEPNSSLGGARTAKLNDGGMIGIRGPMRETETPVVRPYLLVDDIQAAVESATDAGAEVAMPAMPIPEYGLFAIVILGGIECGFWQN